MKNFWPFSTNFLFFSSVALIMPFLVLYYQSLGFTGTQIGLLTGLSPLITLVSAPFWTGLADKKNRHHLILSLALLVSAIVIFSLPFLQSFLLVLLMGITFSVFFAPVISLIDSATMFMLGEAKEMYGRVRVGGTLGFGVFAIIAGLLVQSYGLKMAFWGGTAVLFLAFLFGQKLEHNQFQEQTSFRQGARTLLQNRQWILFLVLAFAGGVNSAVANNYFLPYMKELGAKESIMGIAISMGTWAEIPLLFYGNHLLKRFRAYPLLVLSILFSSIRLLLFAAIGTPWLVFPVQLLNALGYPMMWMAGVAYADQTAPPGLNATAQGLFVAMVSGFGTAVGGFVGGLLLESIGGRDMYLVFGLFLLAVVGIVSLLGKRPYRLTPAHH